MSIKPFTTQISTNNTNSDNYIVLDFTKPIDAPLFNNDIPISDDNKKKRGRSKKSDQKLFDRPSHLIEIDENFENPKQSRELSMMESTEPYENKYKETNNILRSAINQIDNSMIQLQGDIDDIRQSRTMRGKYQYLSLLQSSLGSMISNKIAAARELNNTISKCNDFEMKRFKEVRANADNNTDDDQRVMAMYKAFVNTPVSSNPFPNISQVEYSNSAIQTATIGSQDDNFNSYINNISPQQNMMYLENNPNIKQVVVYNQETGARYFDVIDMTTGQSVPNTEKHDTMFLEDVTIDLKNKVARNINIGETYPLVVVGQPITDEY